MLDKRAVGMTLLGMFLFALAAGCSGRRAPTAQTLGGDRPGDLSDLQAGLLSGINRERQRRGLPALEFDARLAAAAREPLRGPAHYRQAGHCPPPAGPDRKVGT